MIKDSTTSIGMPLTGLSSKQAELSRQEYGDNSLKSQKGKTFLQQLLASFGDPIIKILLIALAINLIFMFKTFDWFETIGIAVAVLLATVVSTLSERGSELAFQALQEEASQTSCRVLRNGQTVSLPITEIVVGDLVLLEAGEKIPADGTVISGRMSVDQSALNGESREAAKEPFDLGSHTPDLLDKSSLFRGAMLCSGEGVMQVTAVGAATFYGSMAQELSGETRESPLKLRLAKLAGILSKLGYCAAIIVALAFLCNTYLVDTGFDPARIAQKLQDIPLLIEQVLDALTMAITVVVVAVPEGLPMMITVVLSSNMKRMLKDHVLVRKPVGIETAGSLNILFTDKTGTLTSGMLSLSHFVSGDGKGYASASKLREDAGLYRMVELSARYNTASDAGPDGVIGGNATDRAILSYVLPLGQEDHKMEIHSKIPFDSKYKFSAVRLGGGENLTLIKGAPEKLLTAATHYYDAEGKVRPLTNRGALHKKWTQMTKQAMRVLALAATTKPVTENGGFDDLILIGLAGIKDETRPQASRAVSEIRQAGVQVVMITGDNRETAAAVARECGVIAPNEPAVILTGSELAAMSDEELHHVLPEIRVVARALPTDKSRLVRIAQEEGLVAGMTGDGINDAPALKAADVGFAMGSGTEVAKEAGDIVILDNNIASISKAVLYGRTIFKSIRKFIIFQLTMNLCAVGVSIIGPFIGIDTPVTVIQMLWINIIMDTLGALAFAGEAPLMEFMHEKPKRRDEPILNKYMINQIVCLGGFTIALCLTFLKLDFLKPLFRYSQNPIYFMTAFFALFIFAGIFNCFNARTHRIDLLANLSRNKAFLFIMAGICVVQTLFIYFGGQLFRTAPLYPRELILVVLLAFLVIPADLIRKAIIRSRGRMGTI